jgi:putative membrane protein
MEFMGRLRVMLLTVLASYQCSFAPAPERPEARFAELVARTRVLEVQLADIARSHTASEGVRAFAESILAERAHLDAGLARAAEADDVDLPDDLLESQQYDFIRLSCLRGEAFDRAYLAAMIAAREQAIEAFHEQAARPDSPISEWARLRLPLLESQLALARALELSPSSAPRDTARR